MTINIIFITMWASWIFLASVEGLCGVWVFLEDFFPPQYLLPKKNSLFQSFSSYYTSCFCCQSIKFPSYMANILARLLFAAMKYLPSGFFSFTICSHSWVMWQQHKPQESREEEEEQRVHRSVYCLRPLLALQTLTITFKRYLIAVQHFCPFADPLILNVSKF